jgi:hypothetical protein
VLAFKARASVAPTNAATLGTAAREHERPKRIRVDNGPEFVSRDLDLGAWQHGVVLDYSRPGKPTDNSSPKASTAASGRMPERILVLEPRRRTVQDRGVARRIQYCSPTQRDRAICHPPNTRNHWLQHTAANEREAEFSLSRWSKDSASHIQPRTLTLIGWKEGLRSDFEVTSTRSEGVWRQILIDFHSR